MFGMIGAESTKVCNIHWGYLAIILAYLAFLCYWMFVKNRRQYDLVVGIATGVLVLIGFILAFFAVCPVCWVLIVVGMLILGILFLYYFFTENNLKKIGWGDSIFFVSDGALFVAAFVVAVVIKLPLAMLFIAIDVFAICLVFAYLLYKEIIAMRKPPVENDEVQEIEEDEPAEEEVVAAVPCEEAAVEVVEPEEETEATLKESFSIMDALVSQSTVTKASVYEFLEKKYGDKVVLNRRPNRTKNDRLPMADTHFAIVGGKKVCFVYVYQNAVGGVLLLVKTNKEHYKMIAAKHAGVKRSAFPRRGEWYSIIVDDTYTSEEIFKILSDAYEVNQNDSFQPTDWTFKVVKKVKDTEVGTMISTEVANSMVSKTQRVVNKKNKGFVNVGQLNQYFKANETVTLDEVKKRVPGMDKNMTFCKLLAHGVLDKPLTVDLDDYSIDAIKMVVITGGKVIKPSKK